MRLSVISFTNNGIALSRKLAESYKGTEIELFAKCSWEEQEKKNVQGEKTPVFVRESVGEWAREQMEEKNILLFIGACGIAVRAIAPCITDKLHDSPVLVTDERGEYVIPILSGHVGGANKIAVHIAECLGATPVITTATDINGKFAVDLFAKKNGLHIADKNGIARISSKVLAGEKITMSIETGHMEDKLQKPEEVTIVSYPPGQKVDVVVTTEEREFEALICLKPREYVIGMGCKRGKEIEKIEALIRKCMEEACIDKNQIFALASIDRKKEEKGFLAWSRKEGIPFFTFSAEQLQEVEGNFQTSAFVKEQVGVDNVCERAALRACKIGGRLILEKYAEDGMTIAIAKREWSVAFDEE